MWLPLSIVLEVGAESIILSSREVWRNPYKTFELSWTSTSKHIDKLIDTQMNGWTAVNEIHVSLSSSAGIVVDDYAQALRTVGHSLGNINAGNWTCRGAGKNVRSIENICHTRALLRWWFTNRRYIKCTYLYVYYNTSYYFVERFWGGDSRTGAISSMV